MGYSLDQKGQQSTDNVGKIGGYTGALADSGYHNSIINNFASGGSTLTPTFTQSAAATATSGLTWVAVAIGAAVLLLIVWFFRRKKKA